MATYSIGFDWSFETTEDGELAIQFNEPYDDGESWDVTIPLEGSRRLAAAIIRKCTDVTWAAHNVSLITERAEREEGLDPDDISTLLKSAQVLADAIMDWQYTPR